MTRGCCASWAQSTTGEAPVRLGSKVLPVLLLKQCLLGAVDSTVGPSGYLQAVYKCTSHPHILPGKVRLTSAEDMRLFGRACVVCKACRPAATHQRAHTLTRWSNPPCPCRLDEEARSLGYFQEAHRVWPVNLDVISWLGALHVRNEVRTHAPAAGWLAGWLVGCSDSPVQTGGFKGRHS